MDLFFHSRKKRLLVYEEFTKSTQETTTTMMNPETTTTMMNPIIKKHSTRSRVGSLSDN